MTEDSIKCAARRHTHNISNNQLLDKEEYEADKSDHKTSVLSHIYSTTFNGGIPKGLTLKKTKNTSRIIYEAKLHITRFYWRKRRIFCAFQQEPSISCTTMSRPCMIFMRHHYPSPLVQSEDEKNMEQLH